MSNVVIENVAELIAKAKQEQVQKEEEKFLAEKRRYAMLHPDEIMTPKSDTTNYETLSERVSCIKDMLSGMKSWQVANHFVRLMNADYRSQLATQLNCENEVESILKSVNPSLVA